MARYKYTPQELRSLRSSVGDLMPGDLAKSGFVEVQKLFFDLPAKSAQPVKGAMLDEKSENRYVLSWDLREVGLNDPHAEKLQSVRFHLNRINPNNVTDVVSAVRRVGLPHDEVTEIVLGQIVGNIDRPDANPALRPVSQFVVRYSQLYPTFCGTMKDRTLCQLRDYLKKAPHINYLVSGSVWLAQLTISECVSTYDLCSFLYDVRWGLSLSHSLEITTATLSFSGKFFDHHGIWELNYFYLFLKQNSHPIGFHEFQRTDLLAKRANGWRRATASEISRIAQPVPPPRAASGWSDREVSVHLRGCWEDCYVGWLEGSGIIVPSVPAEAGRTVGEEEALQVLFSLLEKHTRDREDFGYFVVDALTDVHRRKGDHIEGIIRRLIGAIKTILPEIDDSQWLGVNFWLIVADFVAESYQAAVRSSWLFQDFVRSQWRCPIAEFLRHVIRIWDDAKDEPSLTVGEAEAIFGYVKGAVGDKDCAEVVWVLVAATKETESETRVVPKEAASWYDLGREYTARMEAALGCEGDPRPRVREIIWEFVARRGACPEGFLIELAKFVVGSQKLEVEEKIGDQCIQIVQEMIGG